MKDKTPDDVGTYEWFKREMVETAFAENEQYKCFDVGRTFEARNFAKRLNHDYKDTRWRFMASLPYGNKRMGFIFCYNLDALSLRGKLHYWWHRQIDNFLGGKIPDGERT